VIESAWGQSSPFSVGVEEEVMILDAATLQQAPRVDVLLGEGEGFHTELHASVVELKTGICASATEAAARLRSLRSKGEEITRRNGLCLCASGTHPVSDPELQPIVELERYRAFVEYAGVSARRQGVNGLHVHVGMPGPDECWHCLEAILPWLPVVLAVSANSPYLAGRETGLASNRAEVLTQLPRSGAPPPFESYAAWERFVDDLVALGVAADYTVLWWDVRPHPRFGTLEVRAPDQPTAPPRTAAFVALIQALCAAALEWPRRPPEPAGRGIYQQNRWAALRFGPEAQLVHPDRTRTARAADLAAELIERIGPAAAALGSEGLLDGFDTGVCEGDRQLEVGRRSGLRAVCEDLVARSVPSSP
jgi:glutamate---cysteine ligase / carboxylate-amine ligase